MRFLSFVLVAACTVSCSSIDATAPRRAVVAGIAVHSDSAALAARIAAAVEQMAPLVEAFPFERHRTTGRICAAEVDGERLHGETLTEGDIRLFVSRKATEAELRAAVAHELAHGGIDPRWRALLPGVIEEGLCEHVAQRLVPEYAVERRTGHAVALATVFDDALRVPIPARPGHEPSNLCWTLKAYVDLDRLPEPGAALRLSRPALHVYWPEVNRAYLTSLGFLLVQRIGIESLTALVEEASARGEAQVSAQRLLIAAGLGAVHSNAWRIAVREFADADVRAYLERRCAGHSADDHEIEISSR